MAKKSKTQRAKASAARQQRKADRENGVVEEVVEAVEEEKKPAKVSIFKKSDDEQLKAEKKAEKKAKKVRFKFLKEVKAELKRVTWPSRSDVLRWTGVVVIALIFFGLFVGLLDNVIITPLLVLISGIGA